MEVTKSHQPNGLSLPKTRRRTPIISSSDQTHCRLAGAKNVTLSIAHLQSNRNDNSLIGRTVPSTVFGKPEIAGSPHRNSQCCPSAKSGVRHGDEVMPAEAIFRYTENARPKDANPKDKSYGCHIASHNSYRRNRGCYPVERRGGALPPRPLVRQNYSLVFGTFAGFWLALLFPLRPFALSLQRRLWSLLRWPLAVQQPVSGKSRGQPSRAPGCRIALPR